MEASTSKKNQSIRMECLLWNFTNISEFDQKKDN